ncbi:Uncharacterised protein [Streptococcus pneumoniae]|nr:Uncharacterised protein [Streptococcus pneumoniae]CIV83635.1 Uncharacterised protein [Streptococcus pneumoniae]
MENKFSFSTKKLVTIWFGDNLEGILKCVHALEQIHIPCQSAPFQEYQYHTFLDPDLKQWLIESSLHHLQEKKTT